ncbi:MAG: helix-turn-helix domain-containing protein [Polyangiaceae bacterium]|nr:helix-turn-helix domain-containing protein [Polyangiaceae bacterium]
MTELDCSTPDPLPHVGSMGSPLPTPRREDVPADATTSITVRKVTQTRFDYPWHFHPEIELNLTVSGRGMRYVGDSIEPFEPGEVTLIAGGTPHAWLSYPGPEGTDAGIIVQFSLGAFGRDFLELPATRPIGRLLERAAHGLLFLGEARAMAARDLIRLAESDLSSLKRLTLLLTILATLADRPEHRTLSVGAGQGGAIARDATRAGRVMSYLNDHSAARLSQREIARLVGMAPGTFSRFFTRQFGRPFVNYLAEVRVGNACRLLLDDDLGVAEVAYRVGFNNLANFNRHFRKMKGITPTGYRKLVRAAR